MGRTGFELCRLEKSIKEGCINCEDERVKHAKLNMVLKRLFARFANQQAIVEVDVCERVFLLKAGYVNHLKPMRTIRRKLTMPAYLPIQATTPV